MAGGGFSPKGVVKRVVVYRTGAIGPPGAPGSDGADGADGLEGPEGPPGPSAAWGDITGTLSTQTDLQTALNTKAPLASPAFTGTPTGITKTHVGLSNVDNTTDAGKPVSTAAQTALDGKSATGHTHTGVYEPANANIQVHVVAAHAPADAQKNSNITKAEIEAKLTGEIASHTHAGGGGVSWGGITGTLSTQTDLQAALDAKQATLVSATNIKTVNSASILGSGNLVVAGATPDVVSQKRAPTAGTTIAADYGAYIPMRFEILAGLALEIGVGAAFEIG